MKALLTGGSGMLGRALLRLAKPGEIKLVAPPRLELDLRDARAVEAYLKVEQFDLVIHAAAKVGGIAANIADPSGFLAENVAINMNLIGGAATAGVRHLLNIGSSCMYPKDYQQPLKEDYVLCAPLEPTNEGYALAKIMSQRHCEYLSNQHGLHYRTIVPCNLYGPGDCFDLGRSHLVASAIAKLHRAKVARAQEVEIWGDGTARREFLYVDDLAEWILRQTPVSLESFPHILNLGFGRDHSVLEYYEGAAKAVGYNGHFAFDRSKPTGMRVKLIDSSRAAAFGWIPQTSLEEGLQRSYQDFMQSHR